MLFLTYSWRFLISNELEQLELILENIVGIQKHAGKVRIFFYFSSNIFHRHPIFYDFYIELTVGLFLRFIKSCSLFVMRDVFTDFSILLVLPKLGGPSGPTSSNSPDFASFFHFLEYLNHSLRLNHI